MMKLPVSQPTPRTCRLVVFRYFFPQNSPIFLPLPLSLPRLRTGPAECAERSAAPPGRRVRWIEQECVQDLVYNTHSLICSLSGFLHFPSYSPPRGLRIPPGGAPEGLQNESKTDLDLLQDKI